MSITERDYVLTGSTVDPSGAGGYTLPDVFAAAADAGGTAPAVFCADGFRSWQRWRTDADALARGLQEAGVGVGDVVAVHLPNCWEFLVTHVAVAAAGAVILPLPLGLGPREVAALLHRAGAGTLIVPAARPGADALGMARQALETGPVGRVLVTGAAVPEAGIGSFDETVAGWAGSRPWPVPLRPESPFALLASSGTTSAVPKICVHSHTGLLSNAATVAADAGASGADTILSASPLAHLFGLSSIHMSLFTGGRQALLAGWDVDSFADVARRSRASVLFAVPAQLRDIVARARSGAAAADIRLREVRTGGAAVPESLVTDLRRTVGARVMVQWGMSEVGAGILTRPGDPPEAATRSIGRPLTGAQVRVVADTGAECGPGEVGELQFRGPSLFRGYLGEEALTRAAVSDDGWLRTGDRASRAEDGSVTYHGRNAELINVGGAKFAASEVESLLSDMPQLRTVAIAGRADERLGEYPCVVVATRPGTTVDLDEIVAHLTGKGVASYKQPLELVVVDEIPVTPSGKIARGRLRDLLDRPVPARSGRATRIAARSGWAARIAARSGWATRIAARSGWAARIAALPVPRRLPGALALVTDQARSVTGVDLGPDATFRHNGFDSVSAVRLARRLAAETGLPLATTVVFDHPTPRALAGHLVAHAVGTSEAPAVDVPPVAEGGPTADPIAIVGIGCRFPGGVTSPEEFWRLLADGRNAVSAFPTDRGWDLTGPNPGGPGSTYVRHGGFLDRVAEFDAGLFGISPREADAMDPQQRVLLETAWEAIERSGIDPGALRGTDTGVFVGMMAGDYAPRVTEAPDRYDGYLATGVAPSVASGRIAYALGLTGPALTVDTACSSSLVALHLAAGSLRRGECSTALVGGVTVMSTPASFVEFSQQQALAPDGRCKPFAASADGAAWAEGAGVLVLQRLSDALRAGRTVLAVLRGSAVNQDGASNGLTAPSGPAQQQVIRRALADAGLSAGDVDAVEAHGTGTPLGDPIEADALLATYGRHRTQDRPVWLGSVKSNLGHTQAAAGIAGIVKVVLAMHHGTLPRTLGVDAPSPHVNWAAGGLRLLREPVAWPRTGRPRRAAVSAFGISGTNAHTILEEPPAPVPADGPAADDGESPVPWAFSAADADGLRAMAGRLAGAVAVEGVSPAQVGRALATTRSSRLEHRAVVVGRTVDDFRTGLTAIADGAFRDDVVTGRASVSGGTVFVFPGQGTQWAGMAAGLLDTSPAFAASVAACEDAFAPHVDWSLRRVLRGDDPTLLDRDDVTQAALFTVMVSLAAAWRSYGVRPDAVLGHSQGEVAAAYVAGALSLADAATIVAARGNLAVGLTGSGAMAAAALTAGEVSERLQPWGDGLSVAAVNGPRSVVVAGSPDAVAEFVAALSSEGVPARTIPVRYASHSAHVDGVRDALIAALRPIRPGAGDTPFYSTVDSGWREPADLDAGYWFRNLRRPVAFEPAVRELLRQGYRHFVEMSPHPALTTAIQDTAAAAGVTATVTGSLRRDDGGLRRLLLSMGMAYVGGVPVTWAGGSAGRTPPVALPTYPFQGRRHWLSGGAAPVPPASPAPAAAAPAAEAPAVAPTAASLLDLVRQHTAEIAGYPGPATVPAWRSFHELGLTSLGYADLSRRLTHSTGVAVTTSTILDHATPEKLSAHLGANAPRPAPEPSTVDNLTDVAATYRTAVTAGRAAQAHDLLRAVARLRPAFSGAAANGGAAPTRLRAGAGGPTVLCLPSALPLSGPHEYVRLAAAMPDGWTVLTVPQPGFGPGEGLPADVEALAAHHAGIIRQHLAGIPLVLCGHSSGGLIAHAVAQALERTDDPAAALVLLDPYPPDRVRDTGAALIAGSVADTDPGVHRLTAAAAYLEILSAWQPATVDTPALVLRAARLAAGLPAAPAWRLPHDAAVVAGDHFSMVGDEAAGTAGALAAWLAAPAGHLVTTTSTGSGSQP